MVLLVVFEPFGRLLLRRSTLMPVFLILFAIGFSFTQFAALAKSDWVEDDADLKTRSSARPTNSAPTDSGQADDMTGSPELKGNGPLRANVTRWDGNSSPSPARGQNNPSNWGNVPVRAMPIGPPREAKVSQQNFRNWLNDTHGALSARIQSQSKDRILEIKGQWDDAGHIIHSFGLPFTRINADQIAKAPLDNVEAIVVDCGSTIPVDAQLALRGFVSRGGYLVTTDWALDSCLVHCFPGYVEWNGDYTDPGVVDAIVVSRDPDLTKNVDSPSYWKLEKRSQFVHQINPNVEVLARSRSLIATDRYQQGILALAFTYGKGRVLHLVGHFDNNSEGAFNNILPDASPRIIVSLRQALAANFLVDAFCTSELRKVQADRAQEIRAQNKEQEKEKSAQAKQSADNN